MIFHSPFFKKTETTNVENNNFVREEALDNIVKEYDILATSLSGVGSVENQIAEYLTNTGIEINETDSAIIINII